MTKKGKVEGIILRNGQDDKPWLDETLVGFIKMKDAKKLNKLKKKNFEKYKPKDILGYGFDDQLYLTRKYAASAKIGIKVLGRKWFLKTIVDGNLKVFTYYEQPSNVNLLGVSDAEKEAERDRTRKDFHILLQKGEGELQIIKKALAIYASIHVETLYNFSVFTLPFKDIFPLFSKVYLPCGSMSLSLLEINNLVLYWLHSP